VKSKLLIIDDDEEIRSQMRWSLGNEYEISLAENRPNALQLFKTQRPPVVLLDLGLPPQPGETTEGMAALAEMLAIDPFAKVIIITGQSERQHAINAVGQGAFGFAAKPVDIAELRVSLRHAFYLADLEKDYRALQQTIQTEMFEHMLGSSPQMREVFSLIRKVATTDAPVLILGESGTGKEMAALGIHHRSARKSGPFIAINCGAIPENLLESELFGHEKGSFTGAHAQRPGRIESAAGGTLFLDEIGELPLNLQVKLLRFLQEQFIERVGGRKEIHVDTRVIAATNSDLTKALKEGKFREDLYYRLAVVVLRLPPLRERSGDIHLLAQAFLKKFGSENSKARIKFAPGAVLAIEKYSWPGNVRELENRVRRAVIMSEGAQVTATDLELQEVEAAAASEPRTLKEAREAVERDLVQRALRRHNGKIAPAAADLGISRPTLYELMEKLGLHKETEAAS
jgi:two-component system, NtrC family, response regulator